MEESYEVFSITDIEGGELQVAVVDTLQENGREYYAVMALTEDGQLPEEGELIVGQMETEENGDQYFTEIEDDDEYDRISQTFIDRMEEELIKED